eukprot:426033-Alexandrium_andersonii.AAC.1
MHLPQPPQLHLRRDASLQSHPHPTAAQPPRVPVHTGQPRTPRHLLHHRPGHEQRERAQRSST